MASEYENKINHSKTGLVQSSPLMLSDNCKSVDYKLL